MNVKNLLIVNLLLLSCLFCEAQNISKPNFIQVEYASYNLNSIRTKEKDKVEVEMFVSIDSNGFMKIRRKHYDGKIKYHTAQLNDSMLNVLNQVFIEESLLKDYMIEKSLKKGFFYAGGYSYLHCKLPSGKEDDLCFIQPFMSKKFNDVMDKWQTVFYKQRTEVDYMNLINEDLLNRILSLHKQSKYMPAITEVPGQVPSGASISPN